MTEGDELLAMIREIVAFHGVAPQQQAVVSDAAARVVLTVLSNPHFYNNLSVVLALRQQNEMLRQQLANVSALVYRANLQPKKTPAKKAPAKKRAAAKRPVAKAPTIKVKGSTAANRQAFKQGYKGR